ncbi:MAG: histidine kinase [Kordiimonadaceae bacterium]|nr:histidine kinase [Kordiimonadaceae bacterium]
MVIFETENNTDENEKMVGDNRRGYHNKKNLLADIPHTNNTVSDMLFADTRARGTHLFDNLFRSKERIFWAFQVFGWFGYLLVRVSNRMVTVGDVDAVPLYAAVAVFGFILTSYLRLFYRRLKERPFPVILLAILIGSAVCGAILSAFATTSIPFFMPGEESYKGLQRLGNAMFESTVIFAWSVIYFGHHYYKSFLEQKQQVLKATAMAHQAQLKMLRYQLNPHFLFNTLNAISTLVLEKSGKDANRMLTKLSSFLRYTLVNEPTQLVPLQQELHALNLYLDIEKVRFQERLVIEFDIQEKAKLALVPSLILQPLIENVIKYAIAPSIDGGMIMICAKVENKRLLIGLTDNGPGMDDVKNTHSKSGSGVGLANTKERLAQIYGEKHSLVLKNMEPTGLGVFIELPFDLENIAQ